MPVSTPIDLAAQSTHLSEVVLDSLRRCEIPATPNNYAIWYQYHSGSAPDLQKTIDALLSNNAQFDERTLHDLYSTFFSPVKEERAIRDATTQIMHAMHEVLALTDRARVDAKEFGATLAEFFANDLEKSLGTLQELIDRLVDETRKMAGRSAYVGVRMKESAEKIEALERNLETALRDATVDGLTGVANRKCFDTSVRQLAGNAMNSGDDLAMLMVDIDHFKAVNDTWGHLVGDSVLRHVAQVLKRVVRGQDHVARYGGEEFSILLPTTDIAAAASVGENIRGALAKDQLVFNGEVIRITVSVGAACYEPGDPLCDWIGRADNALYKSKKEGRDCVRTC
jgi:diguanylate cyclase